MCWLVENSFGVATHYRYGHGINQTSLSGVYTPSDSFPSLETNLPTICGVILPYSYPTFRTTSLERTATCLTFENTPIEVHVVILEVPQLRKE